ncbi:glycosyltransferase [bacterium]|nr:glycosyltransferase [bacterium]
MKVAIVGPYPLNPYVLRGGVEAATHYLVQGLIQRDDVDLRIFAPTKSVDRDTLVKHKNVTVHYLAEKKRRLMPNMIANIRRLSSAIDKWHPDLVHAEHPCGALAGSNAQYPTVFTIHGVIHREQKYTTGSIVLLLNRSLLNHLTKKALLLSDYVIPVSPYVVSEYKPLIRGGIRIIPNAVDDSFFHIPNADAGSFLLYVGNISPLKNITGLIHAFRLILDRVPDSKLMIAGIASSRLYSKEVNALVSDLSLADNVHFLGTLDQSELEKQYAQSSIVCHFSSHETFCLALSQGMAAGKPVVSTDSGGPSSLIDDGRTGYLVPVGDENAFADRCIKLLSDTKLRKRMGDEARKEALASFSKEIIAEKTVEVYREVLGTNACY